MQNSVRRFVFAICHSRDDSRVLAVIFQLVMTASTFARVARVLRCAVWRLDDEQGATYGGALLSEDRCDIVWEPETRYGSPLPTGGAQGRPAQGHALPAIEGRSRGDRSRSVK